MKRFISMLLVVALLVGLIALFPAPVAAAEESAMKVSDALVELLKEEEGFLKYPTYDYSQWTVGYGCRCPSDMLDYYKKHGITEAEAELLLRNYLSKKELAVNRYLVEGYGLKLTQGQFDALVSFSYNMGSSWMQSKPENSNIMKHIVNGSTGSELIDAFTRWCNAGSSMLTGLIRRRLSEANMYLNGIYYRKGPANYCYVTYNGNGGSISQKIQGFDSNENVLPYCEATYENFTFDGWYTAAVGGTKVTKLTSDLNKKTLYAHWKEIHDVTEEEAAKTVEVTVTVDALNLRKGPGTNYALVGSAAKGDVLTVLQTQTVDGVLWGQVDDGWACLEYTNYAEVTGKNETTDPADPTEPEATEPEATVPPTEPETTEKPTEPETTEKPTEPETTEKPTEPETTEKPTEPETTEKPTEPETTEKPTEPETTEKPTEPETTEKPTEPETTAKPTEPEKVMGTVISNAVLNVRSGPGTAYSVVKTLKPKAQVQILEQKTVGSMIWGKTPDGWVSMEYIKLDEEETEPPVQKPETEDNSHTTTTITGTVTCAVLNVRSGAGVNYSLSGTYKSGNTVTVTETKTVGSTTWGKTAKGWVSMAYIKIKTTTTTTTPAPTTNQTGTVVSSDVLRVRSGAGTSYAVVAYLNPKTTVTITETKKVGSTTWGKTSKGWVSMDYIKLDTQTNTGSTGNSGDSSNNNSESAGTSTERTGTIVDANPFLNVRSGAGTNYAVKGYYYNGDKITILETKKVGDVEWGKTEKGWLSMAYVKLDPLKDENGNVIYVVNKTVDTAILNVRSGPGTNYDIVAYLYEGDKVEITEIKIVNDKAWAKIAQGWVSMSYLV